MKNNEEIKKYCVYLHTVPKEISGYDCDKYYVGMTSNFKKRWEFCGCNYKGQVFYNAIQKYGWDNLKHEILYSDLSKEEASDLEIKTISELKSNERKYGYNIASGGVSGGVKPRPIAQYDISGKLIATYASVRYAEEKLENTSISNAVRNKNSLACNSLWRYYDETPEETIEPYINTTKKAVMQYDLVGNFIKEWSSVSEAEKEYKSCSIGECCLGKTKTALGYQWKYKNDSLKNIENLLNAKKIIKPIYVYTIDGEYIGTFKNRSDARKSLGIKKPISLTDCLNGDITNNKAYGYRWSLFYYEKLPPLKQFVHQGIKPVIQMDFNNNIINIFNSIEEASKNTTGNALTISRCCRNICSSSGGYKWKFIQDIKESDISDSFLLQKYKFIIKRLDELKKEEI